MPQDSRWPADTGTGEIPTEGDTALRDEHARLVGENLEYMAVLSRYARGMGLCATTSFESLTERILEILCLETRSQSGVLWVASEEGADEVALVASVGLAKPAEEPASISISDPAPGWEGLSEPGCGSFPGPAQTGSAGPSLCVRLRGAGRLLGLARVSEPANPGGYGLREISAAEQIAEVAAVGLSNALRFRALERRSLRDPTSQTYTPAFFDGVAARELERARRFGRPFSVLDVELCGLPAVRAADGSEAVRRIVDGFTGRLQQALRGTDVCASEGERRYRILLAETDAIGAVVLKWRIQCLLETYGGNADVAPSLRVAAATFPGDGAQLDELARTLARRLASESRSLARVLERESRTFGECRQRLLREAVPVPPRLSEQALGFVLEEVRRCSHERGLVWLCPGSTLRETALGELSRLRGRSVRAEIVLLSDEDARDLLGLPITWASAHRIAAPAPFLVYLGERSAYAWLGDRDSEDALVFHTSDRALVEHLALYLQRDLAGAASA